MAEPTPQWRLYMPMWKAVQADDGRLWIEGIASDESVDLENEIVKASALQDSIRILCERGQIDWDHGRVIGGVEKAGLLPAEEALLRFPEVREWFGRDYTGRHVFWLRGWLDPPPEGEPANADLLDARHAVKSGHRLGFSLAGGRLKRGQSQGPDGRIYPSTEQAIITKVALTPCPINTSTVARLAKSLSAAMAEPDGDEPVWVIAKGIAGGGGGLTAGTGTDHATFAGGRSLTPESLHGQVEDTLWSCSLCATGAKCGPDDDTPPRCRVCGGEMVRKDRPRRAIRKGLSPLQRIAHDLSTEEDDTMALEEATEKLRKSVFGTLARVFGKAAELDDEDLEDIEDDVVDLAEEVEEAGEPPADEVPGEDEEGDLPLGVEDEADEAPTEGDVDDVLAELEDAEDAVPDLYGDEDEDFEDDEDEEDEDAMPPVRKSLKDWLAEAEDGPETVEVLEAEGLLDGVLGAFEKSIGTRLDAQDEAIAATMEAAGQIVEMLGAVAEALPDMRKSVQEAEEAEERRQAAIGAIPAGTRVRKSVKDGDPVHTPAELENRITKALQGNLIGLTESGALRVNVRGGALEEVAAALDHAGA